MPNICNLRVKINRQAIVDLCLNKIIKEIITNQWSHSKLNIINPMTLRHNKISNLYWEVSSGEVKIITRQQVTMNRTKFSYLKTLNAILNLITFKLSKRKVLHFIKVRFVLIRMGMPRWMFNSSNMVTEQQTL